MLYVQFRNLTANHFSLLYGTPFICIGHDDGKLLASVPSGHVGGTIKLFLQDFGYLLQTLVAGDMAICVIKRFEVVDIQYQE